MNCPICQDEEYDTKVLDTRSVGDFTLRRRRECKKCNHRFTTKEVVIEQLKVIKSNGRTVDFEDDKISKSIQTACNGSITQEKINEILDYIFEQTLKGKCREIHSKNLGQLVLNKLKETNEVAYIRYASVYFKFKTAEEFHNLLKKF